MTTSVKRLLLGVALLSSSACVTPTSNVLVIDGKDPSAIDLCTTESTENAKEKCHRYGNEDLQAPSVLAVKIKNADETRNYSMTIEQAEVAASGPSAADILREVMKRAIGIPTDLIPALTNAAPESAKTEKEKAIYDLLVKARDQVLETGKAVATKEIDKLEKSLGGARKVSRGRTPSDIVFDGWVKAKKIENGTPVPNARLGTKSDPPIRTYPLIAEDLVYLQAQQIDLGELVAHAEQWCVPESYGKVPYDGYKTEWAKYPPPDTTSVLKALLLDEAKIRGLLEGKRTSLDLSDRIKALVGAAHKKIDAGTSLDEAERVVHYLYWSSAVVDRTQRCLRNVDFLLEQSSSVPGLKAKEKDLKALRVKVEAFEKTMYSASTSFRTFIQPLVIVVWKDVVEGKTAGGVVSFAARTLVPGTLTLAVHSSTTGATKSQQLASLKLRVKPFERIAVGIGAVVTLCKHCLVHVEEALVPGENNATTRQLRAVYDSQATSPAVVVHFSLWPITPSSQIGALIGYPLDDTTGTFKNILGGLSYRHTVGFVIAAGVQVFESTKLKASYQNTIDGSALSVDDVTTERPEVAFFIFTGLTTDAFGGL